MGTSLAVLIALLISVAIPFAVGYVSKENWSGGIKFAVAVVCSLIVGFGAVLISGQVELSNVPELLLQSIIAAKASYWLFIEKTGAKEWLASHGNSDNE